MAKSFGMVYSGGMKGKLIIVSGYSGAGKSTLIRGVIDSLENTEYLRTVVTRPRRDDDESLEYDFVSDDEYENRRQLATMWDHVEHQGFKYGVDVDWVYQTLRAGTNLMCAIAPDKAIYTKLAKLYGNQPISIWVDTDKDISQARVNEDTIRSARQESSELRDIFQHIFTPSRDMAADQKLFARLIIEAIKDDGTDLPI